MSGRGMKILFFFQAEDGLRDGHVTGVQTCALPISSRRGASRWSARLAMASLMASQTEIASISGGPPIALDRKIVAARFGASSSSRALKIGGRSRLPGIL